MYLIVGLGNPEEEYKMTRHNSGFEAINKIADKYNITLSKKKFDGFIGDGKIGEEKVVLLKPQTYMNLSGNSVIQAINFYKVPLENVIVIYDDIDIPTGITKIRKKGGPGTHNGMKSVVECLNTIQFPHIRIGIGLPKYKGDLVNHVLEKLSDEEYKEIEKGINVAADSVEKIISIGIDKAMNEINTTKESE